MQERRCKFLPLFYIFLGLNCFFTHFAIIINWLHEPKTKRSFSFISYLCTILYITCDYVSITSTNEIGRIMRYFRESVELTVLRFDKVFKLQNSQTRTGKHKGGCEILGNQHDKSWDSISMRRRRYYLFKNETKNVFFSFKYRHSSHRTSQLLPFNKFVGMSTHDFWQRICLKASNVLLFMLNK